MILRRNLRLQGTQKCCKQIIQPFNRPKYIFHNSRRAFGIVDKKESPHLGQSLEPGKRNIDFPLNLGYNDHYKILSGGKLSLWSRLKFLIFKNSYNNQFRNKYNDLLSSIYLTQYHSLEQIMAANLLKKLAADIYEKIKIQNCDFEILNEKAKVDVRIINYSQITIPELSEDEEIGEYALVRDGNNKWKFGRRNDSDNDLVELNLRLKAKQHYMISPEVAIKNAEMGAEPILVTKEVLNDSLLSSIESKERERAKKLKTAASTIHKSIVENARKEYSLLRKCMPHKLLKSKEFFDQQYEKMKNQKIDVSNKGDESLDDLLQKNRASMNYEKYISMDEFLKGELQLIDTYKFCKFFMTKYYKNYIQLPKEAVERIKEDIDYKGKYVHDFSVNQLSSSLEEAVKVSGRNKFFNRIRDLFFRKRKDGNHVIEVFDVIFYSKKRLEILNSQKESYLLKDAGYEGKIEKILKQDDLKPQSSVEDQKENYVVKDPRIVDVRNPDYLQVHHLRFEKGNKKIEGSQNKYIITDIDLWMEGNISAKRYL
ncbi:unnamed protein product [Moneuplotes crassus]|uniref:Uncharacterized protein n=1 Tax=Euplotes crassus TaxID=5936 RepID=A0AAD1UB49_EUPCR|nr:unnamed protein product [Moneuplotes crassus]